MARSCAAMRKPFSRSSALSATLGVVMSRLGFLALGAPCCCCFWEGCGDSCDVSGDVSLCMLPLVGIVAALALPALRFGAIHLDIAAPRVGKGVFRAALMTGLKRLSLAALTGCSMSDHGSVTN